MAEAMAIALGSISTTDEVLDGVNLRGKRVLVTGVSAGLGIETARTLAAHGADVVGAARDLVKAESATATVASRGHTRRQFRARRPRSRRPEKRPRLRQLAAQRRQVLRRHHRQRRRDGYTLRPHRRWLRDPVRHKSSRPLRPCQPHRSTAALRQPRYQPVLIRAIATATSISTIRTSSALPTIRSSPTAVPRPRTSSSLSRSTSGTAPVASAPPPFIPAASTLNSAAI